jgi:hypothetical protein
MSNDTPCSTYKASMIVDGAIASLAALEITMRLEPMSPVVVADLLWSVTHQLEQVKDTLLEATLTDP